jgi:hypothetical protein
MRLAVRVWPWVLALLVLAPTLAPGYVLSYDMVFVPDLALRSDFLGFGTGLPRAVPSDAVVAVLDEVVPGMLLQKVVLLGALVLAGAGARRLVPHDRGFAQLGATSVYVWNPYVAERLGIGHWPLLLAYAALPWVIDAARRVRAGDGGLAGLVLWLALAALGASGGIMAAVVAIAFVAGLSGPALRRTALVVLAAVTVNLPWVVAGLLHGTVAVTDPTGVEAFASRAEGPLPMPLTLLGLGGIWNAEVVPQSHQGWAAVAWLVLLGAVCLVGARAWWAATPRRDVTAYLLCGAGGLAVAGLGALAPEAMASFVSTVPGAGILRDGARFVALLAPLEAALFGFGTGMLARVSRERVANLALAAGAVLMPLALMPDLAWGLAGALRPVQYPAEYAAAREQLQRAAEQADAPVGAVLILPFTSYRAPDWNHGRRTLDPLGRYLPEDYVASDDLYVDGDRVAGEDPRVRRVMAVLADQGARDPTPELAREGISWVALDRDAERALGRPDLSLPLGADVVHNGPSVQVWSLDRGASSRGSGPVTLVALAAAWALWSGIVLFCLGGVIVRRRGLVGKVMGRRGRW